MSIGFFCLVDIAANTMNIIGARYNLRAGERGGQCIYVVEAGSEGSRLSHVLVRSELSVGSSISSTFRVSGMIFFNLVEAF